MARALWRRLCPARRPAVTRPGAAPVAWRARFAPLSPARPSGRHRRAAYGLALALAVLPGPGPAGLWAQGAVSEGSGALLRGLDKITGQIADLEIPSGKARRFGSVIVSVEDCRYPTGNPSGNAYAHVSVWNQDGRPPPLFSGWMVAGSPALNALDHPRYDVWVLSCTGT